MTILTILAIFTIGLVIGALASWMTATKILNHLCNCGALKLVAIQKRAGGHIHALIEAPGTNQVLVILEDKLDPNGTD